MRNLSALILSAALILPLPALAEDAGPGLISVTGTGTVQAVPDMATLSIGVTTQGATAAEAMAANSARLEQVMRQLSLAGIQAADIQTSNLSLNPDWGSSSSGQAAAGFIATNTLTIRVRALDDLGAVLDAAVAEGANTLYGLTFGLADPGPALDAARKDAVQAARVRAELLAEAAGVELGRIVRIAEGGSGTDPQPMYRAEAASVPIAAGELGLTADVTITFEIID